MYTSRVSLIGMALLLSLSGARAELPPGAYDKLRVDADSAVVIQIQSVKSSDAENGKEVTVEAKVLGVERSKSGLKKGDVIKIAYFARLKPMPGARPIPILQSDAVCFAFINKDHGKSVYEPAAHAESFRATPEDRQ